MRKLIALSLFFDRLNKGIGRAVAWLLVLMVLVGAVNAVLRACEHRFQVQLSSNALLELQWYVFSLVFLLGAPYALRRGDHVRVDVLYGELPRRGRYWIDLIGTFLFLIPFCLFSIWISVDFVVDSWLEGEMSNDPGGLPRWPLKPVVPLAFFLILLQGISEAIKRVALLRGASPAQVGLEATADEARDATEDQGAV